jgi:hypothetical protein
VASNGITYITNSSEDQSIFQKAESGKFTPTFDLIGQWATNSLAKVKSTKNTITTHVRSPTTNSKL